MEPILHEMSVDEKLEILESLAGSALGDGKEHLAMLLEIVDRVGEDEEEDWE